MKRKQAALMTKYDAKLEKRIPAPHKHVDKQHPYRHTARELPRLKTLLIISPKRYG